MADFTNRSTRRSSGGWMFAGIAVLAVLVLLVFAGSGDAPVPGGEAGAPVPAAEAAPVVTE